MKLQTRVPLERSDAPLSYQSKTLLLGSCFVENMGTKLHFYQFQSKQNPFGILFHPLAIENLVSRAIHGQVYQEKEVFEQDGRWLCFDAHSELNAKTKEALLQQLNLKLKETKLWLEKASHIVITLGTAWIYRNNSTQKTVANCHKVPQSGFTKDLLSPEAIQSSLGTLVDLVHQVNAKARVVFTISPVRHLKDGFVENQRSKANLIAAIHEFRGTSKLARHTSYFESYEIMMDELRDYRFYGRDMIHPNEMAIDYIWEKFREVWISEASYPTMDEVESVQKGLHHRAFNPDSAQHQKFETSLQAKITYLKERYPFMNFT